MATASRVLDTLTNQKNLKNLGINKAPIVPPTKSVPDTKVPAKTYKKGKGTTDVDQVIEPSTSNLYDTKITPDENGDWRVKAGSDDELRLRNQLFDYTTDQLNKTGKRSIAKFGKIFVSGKRKQPKANAGWKNVTSKEQIKLSDYEKISKSKDTRAEVTGANRWDDEDILTDLYDVADENGWEEESIFEFINHQKASFRSLEKWLGRQNKALKSGSVPDQEYLDLLHDLGYTDATKADVDEIKATLGHIVAAANTPRSTTADLASNLQPEPAKWNFSSQQKEDIEQSILRALGVSVGPKAHQEEFVKYMSEGVGAFWNPRYGEFLSPAKKNQLTATVMEHFNRMMKMDPEQNPEAVLNNAINDVISVEIGSQTMQPLESTIRKPILPNYGN